MEELWDTLKHGRAALIVSREHLKYTTGAEEFYGLMPAGIRTLVTATTGHAKTEPYRRKKRVLPSNYAIRMVRVPLIKNIKREHKRFTIKGNLHSTG